MIRAVTVLMTVVVLAGCGGAAAKPPDGLEVAGLTIDSKAVGEQMKVKVVVPDDDAEGRPLLVFLHGRGGNENSALRKPMFAALKALGTRAPIVAFPDGGDHSYWHDRDGGAWGRYVMKEVIPQVVRRFGADRRRVAIGGISMGGFGALDLGRLAPERFCAVGGHSPAVYERLSDDSLFGFDNQDDFDHHDLLRLARSRSPYKAPVWIDVGDQDFLRPAAEKLADELRDDGADVTFHVWPGAHAGQYWDRHFADYLDFYVDACS